MQSFDYRFDVSGDFYGRMSEMNQAVGQFSMNVETAQSWVEKLSQKMAAFELASGYVERLANTFQGLAASGVTLDSQMHDLSAVAGVTGDALKEIEGYARESAKAFGTDAGVAVEGYKLLLSQLTPELGKCPEALQAMGNSIQITSKLMGGDGVAAAQVLTTAMNQYGVSLDDPIAASKTMAEMMNTMAAAGQAGSAELPAIKAALEQCGMAAKAACVSFEETNAAIQVLDKAGKKGSEGGVALRNTLAILSQGRFLPKDTREELQKAGIDVLALADKNKSLKERLEMLKPVLNDSALFSKLFGMENANAARALVQGTD
jgi:TP901 family phage tail tape measure protein